jgi:hypothetical protein
MGGEGSNPSLSAKYKKIKHLTLVTHCYCDLSPRFPLIDSERLKRNCEPSPQFPYRVVSKNGIPLRVRGFVGCCWLFHRHRVHSATVARLNWPARLRPKSLKIQNINSPRAGLRPFCRCRVSSTLPEPVCDVNWTPSIARSSLHCRVVDLGENRFFKRRR